MNKYILFSFIFLFSISYEGDRIIFNQKEDTVELVGSKNNRAKAISDETIVLAMSIKDYSSEKKINATGNVFIHSKKGKDQFIADQVTYFYDKETFSSDQSPVMNVIDSSLYISSREMSGSFKTDIYEAKDNVYIREYSDSNNMVYIWGTVGEYDKKQEISTVISNVKVSTKSMDIYAQKAVYSSIDKVITLYGDMNYEREGIDQLKKIFSGISERSSLTEGDEYSQNRVIIYHYSSEEKAEKTVFKADYVRYSFLDQEVINFEGDVEVENNDGSAVIQSPKISYYKSESFYKTEGTASFIDRNEDMIIRANQFEFYENRDLVYAKGDVKISYDNKEGFAGVILYSRDKRYAILYITPYMISDSRDRVYSDRIEINMKDKSFYMQKNIQGSFGVSADSE